MKTMKSLFDLPTGNALKELGMEIAADNKAYSLIVIKECAVKLAERNGTCTIDDVQKVLGPWYNLGNAAGSVFKGKRWEFTGQWVPSSRASNHGRYIRVWRLK